MKSIGEHLRTAREEKGFSLDQVVHDTNISREYIEALEVDNFDLFPAEAYLVGFLRNYSEYLGLEPSKMVGIYKNYKISEEPVPMDLLLGKKKSSTEFREPKERLNPVENSSKERRNPLLPLILVGVVVLGALAYFLVPLFMDKDNKTEILEVTKKAASETEKSENKEFFLTDETLDVEIQSGDLINVSTGKALIVFTVVIDDNGARILYKDSLKGEQEVLLLADAEKLVPVSDSLGIYFSVNEITENSVFMIAQKVVIDEEQIDGGSDITLSTASEERIEDKILIATETYPKLFTIDAIFRGDGLFRYSNDKQNDTERYYQGGERLKFDVNRTVTFWLSNAGIIDMKILGKEVNLGKNGQVVVRTVKWIKNNETGKYELVIVPLK